MATNLQIDEVLLDEAKRLGGFRTKRETVNRALEDFVGRSKRRRIWDLQGTIDYAPEYNYKEARRKR
ncbi:MAG: type II toxin-antitoxin system VapB family antitoxin [Verrucomicrobiae bacterium]|nr:type II toxin-antitoxin system VapB family antitoxin [Verrucomicrobiae bacterium]MCP5522203.1 type II toxin-antitoxin system VapB family antitoxin [Verrucomicrobiales bacterium]